MINIIIPYYNGSKTIERALHSIAMQTAYRKIVVTIVDDCSTEEIEHYDVKERKIVLENSEDFLFKRIFPKFENLKFFYLRTEKNSGPGAARNLGIKNSYYDWIMFMDADDCLVNPLTIEIINREVRLSYPDIFITRFQQQTNSTLIDMRIENETWVHGKVFKKDFLIKNNIFFPEIRCNEDSAFCSIAFQMAEKIKKLDFVSYLWVNNKESLTRADEDYYGNYAIDYVKGRKFVFEYLNENLKDRERIVDEVLNSAIYLYWMYLDLKNYRSDLLDDFLLEMKSYVSLVEINNRLKWEKFVDKLKRRYWKIKVKPHYGPIVPDIGIIDFYQNFEREDWR